MTVNESPKTYKANELKISKHSLKCPTHNLQDVFMWIINHL